MDLDEAQITDIRNVRIRGGFPEIIGILVFTLSLSRFIVSAGN